jgi:GntR family transcriptional repressor for pyruvate dehydrogenase complex
MSPIDGHRPPPPVALPRRDAPSTEVTRHLVDYLLSGALTAGQRIPSERELAKALDVGRSGVREAIKSLSLLGLLDVRQGAGTFLSSSPADLLPRVIEWGLLLGEPRVYDLMEARTHLEVDVAGLAAERRDDEAVARLRELLERMRAADGDIDRYVEADIEFHLTIAGASGNEVMANLVRSIQSLLQVWAARVLQAAGETATSLEMHAPILDAIERKDVDAARQAMAAHMERANVRLRATVGAPEQAPAS